MEARVTSSYHLLLYHHPRRRSQIHLHTNIPREKRHRRARHEMKRKVNALTDSGGDDWTNWRSDRSWQRWRYRAENSSGDSDEHHNDVEMHCERTGSIRRHVSFRLVAVTNKLRQQIEKVVMVTFVNRWHPSDTLETHQRFRRWDTKPGVRESEKREKRKQPQTGQPQSEKKREREGHRQTHIERKRESKTADVGKRDNAKKKPENEWRKDRERETERH